MNVHYQGPIDQAPKEWLLDAARRGADLQLGYRAGENWTLIRKDVMAGKRNVADLGFAHSAVIPVPPNLNVLVTAPDGKSSSTGHVGVVTAVTVFGVMAHIFFRTVEDFVDWLDTDNKGEQINKLFGESWARFRPSDAIPERFRGPEVELKEVDDKTALRAFYHGSVMAATAGALPAADVEKLAGEMTTRTIHQRAREAFEDQAGLN